jgi:glyoxylase-like metal-dependent hydrolase (beta-lactamase superfamily II)
VAGHFLRRPIPMELQHYTVETLAPGVYAAVARPEGMGGCNAGIIDLGGGTLLFDAAATLAGARELRALAEDLTGRPPDYVINSHVHPDHTNGNVIFADEAALIASTGTREAMAATGLRWMEEFRLQVEATATPEEKEWFRSIYPTPADLRVPELAFDQRLSFAGSRNSAELIALGGHSESDAVLYLPALSILFAGDLITDGNLILCYGDPAEWLKNLDRFDEMAPARIVPGHGEIAGPSAIARARRYIHDLLALTANGGDEEWVRQVPVPEGCGEHWFRENLRALTRR